MRGFLARRRVKKTHGFETRIGMGKSKNSNLNLDPNELEK